MAIVSKAELKRRFKNVGAITPEQFETLIDTFVDLGVLNLKSSDDVTFNGVTAGSVTFNGVTAGSATLQQINLLEQSSPPADPDGGAAVIYMSDGSTSGEAAGDIMMKITSPSGSGATTKTTVLVDFSGI